MCILQTRMALSPKQWRKQKRIAVCSKRIHLSQYKMWDSQKKLKFRSNVYNSSTKTYNLQNYIFCTTNGIVRHYLIWRTECVFCISKRNPNKMCIFCRVLSSRKQKKPGDEGGMCPPRLGKETRTNQHWKRRRGQKSHNAIVRFWFLQ